MKQKKKPKTENKKRSSMAYISLNEASKKFGYTPGYFGILCRTGKLNGKKIGRNWVTREEWVKNFLSQNISNGKGGGENFQTGEMKERLEIARAESKRFLIQAIRKIKNWGIVVLAKLEMVEQNFAQKEKANEENSSDNSFSPTEAKMLSSVLSFALIIFVVASPYAGKFFQNLNLKNKNQTPEVLGIESEKNSPRVLAALTGTTGTVNENLLNSPKKMDVTAYIVNGENKQIANGEYDVRFSIYTKDRTEIDPYPSDTDASVWEETQRVTIYNGILHGFLGTTKALPENLNFSSTQYFVGIRIGTDPEMIPRKRIGAVPLAIDSMSVGGAKIGTGAGNIIQLGQNGKIDVANLPTGKSGSTLVLSNDSRLTQTKIKISGASYITASNHKLTLNSIDLTSDVDGILPVANGGTGLSDFVAGDMFYYSTGETMARLGIGAEDRVLTVSGGMPSWKALPVLGDVFGTGKAGYITYWTDDKNITYDADGNFYWDLTNNRLGIGTTTPATALDVNGVITATGGNSTNWNNGYTYRVTGAGGTAPLNLSIVGNVLSGSIDDATTTTKGIASFSGTDFDVTNGAVTIDSTITRDSELGTFMPNGTNGQTLYYNNGWLVSSNIYNLGGNVGIGTTNPLGKLHIQNDTDSALYTYDPGVNIFGWVAVDSSDSPINRRDYAYTYQFYSGNTVASATEAMRITNSGYVGIGTTAPNYRLHVSGESGSGPTTIGVTGNTGSYANINIQDLQTGGSTYGIYSGYPAAGDFTIRENTVENRLVIKKTSGNVGIGTTNPSTFKLEVAGDIGPEANNTRNLGSPDRYFNTAYITNLVTGTSGTSGYWDRTGTVLSPVTDGDMLALYANGTNASGNLLSISYNASATLSGTLMGIKVDLNDGYVVPTNQSIVGLRVVLPTTTNTNSSGTVTMDGMSLGYGVGTGINQNGAGATVYSGVNLTLPALTQSSGTLTANGALITTSSSITTGGTANGVSVVATGVGAGTLSGVKISSITGSGGSELALNIGSGWDSILSVNGSQIINGSGVVQIAGGGTGLTSYATGDLIYASGTNTLSNLVAGTGNNGKVLVVSSGVPTWGVLDGSACTDCVVNDPTSVTTQTITPNNQNISSLVVRQTTYATPTEDIFKVTSADGNTRYFYVDKDGNVSTGGVASQTLTLTPESDTTALTLVGTNVPTASLQYINSKNTQGTISNIVYGTAATLAGALIGQKIDLGTNVTATDQSVTGMSLVLPYVTNTTSTSNYKGLAVSVLAGSGINQNGAGTTTFTGVDVTIPPLTQTSGTLVGNGISVSTPSSITTGGTANGVNIVATGVGAGILRGINVDSITAGAGSEVAIHTGTGWDYAAIFEGGNVGIGTTAPAYNLQVAGTLGVGGTAYFASYVGIGTTSPGAFLHVGDGSDAIPYVSSPSMYVTLDGQTDLVVRNSTNNVEARVTAGTSWVIIGSSTNHALSLRTNNANRVFIDSTGNVGIGTTAPAYNLQVAGTLGVGGTAYFASSVGIGTTVPGAALEISSTANPGVIIGDGTTGYLKIGSSLFSKTAGNTLLLNGGLYVNSGAFYTATNSSGLVDALKSYNTSSAAVNNGSLLNFYQNITGTNGVNTSSIGGLVTDITAGAYKGVLTFYTADGTSPSERMRINHLGYVGIGTTNPGQKLEVVGSGYFSSGIYIGTNNSNYLLDDAANGSGSSTLYIGNRAIATVGSGGNIVGTSGYISKFTADNILGNSTIYDNGNVGIGTTSPGTTLQVKGGALTVGVTESYAFSAGNSNAGDFTVGSDGSFIYLQSWNGKAIQINNQGNNTILNPTSDYVGIGTTSPLGKLHIQNSADSVLYTYDPGINIFGWVAVDSSDSPINRRDYAYTYQFYSGNTVASATEAMRITNSGNVGIGTTSPGTTLHIYGANASGLKLERTSGANSNIQYTNTAGSMYAGLTPTASFAIGDSADLSANHAFVTVLNTGNVGIGTTAPGYPLHVVGDIYSLKDADWNQVAVGESATKKGSVGWRNTLEIMELATYAYDYPVLVNNSLYVSNDSNSGNVGIGTTAPTRLLEISNSSSFVSINTNPVLRLLNTNVANGGITTGMDFTVPASDTGVLQDIVTIDAVAGATRTAAGQDGNLRISTMNDGTLSEVMRITNSGYVGIGTTNPGHILDVNKSQNAETRIQLLNETAGTASKAAILFGESATSGKYGYLGHFSSSFTTSGISEANATLLSAGYAGDLILSAGGNSTARSIRFYAGATPSEYMRVNSDGYVGIGTTSPSEKLHVAGRILATGTGYTTNPAGPIFGQYNSTIGYAQAPASGEFQIWNDASATVARFMDSGNAAFTNSVGIGTTAPGTKLDVVGDAYIGAASIGNSGGGYSVAGYNVAFSGTDNSYTYRYSDSAYMVDYGSYGFLSLNVAAAGTAGNTISFTRALNIMPSTGNVGIGTTAPTRKFFVNGDAGGTGAWNNDSDERLKKNIIDIPNALDRVLALHGVEFEWKDTKYHKAGKQIGFIAQEAKEVVPEVVSKPGEYYGMDYASLTALLAEGMKEQQVMIVNQEEVLSQQQELLQKNQNDIIAASQNHLTLTSQVALNTESINILNSQTVELENKIGDLAFTDSVLQKSLESQNISNEDKFSLIGVNMAADEEALAQAQDDNASQVKAIASLQEQVKMLEEKNETLLNLAMAFDPQNIIYKDAAGNLDLGAGKLEADGVVAGAFTVKVSDEETKTLGHGILKAVETDEDLDGIDDETLSDGKSVWVLTKAVSSTAKIFVTAKTTGKEPLAVTEIKAGEKFKVETESVVSKDIEFDWWIVESE